MEWTRGHILGHGSSAVVSIAKFGCSNIFAVKSTELFQSQFLQREQKLMSILSSPYLVGYKGCDITRENNKVMYNIFMEYMPGGTIIDAIHGDRGAGTIKESTIARYTKQIVQGLEYLHSGGIVHCDIKGRNILVGESGAKITDLGCAKWANQEAPLGGTPMFMAPEVARGEEQGFPADIWALGCTIIEMVTGNSPWPNNADDPLSILYRIAYSGESPEIPNFLSDQAKDFVSKCLGRDQRERWTAKELLKHPFLEESNCTKRKQIEDLATSSPTSILDQDVWNSMEEEEMETEQWNSVVVDRIGRLSRNSGEADWRWGETWMTIRSNRDEKSEGGPGRGWVGKERNIEEEEGVGFIIRLADSNKKVRCCSSCSNNKNTCAEFSPPSVLVGSLINLERLSPLLDHQFQLL